MAIKEDMMDLINFESVKSNLDEPEPNRGWVAILDLRYKILKFWNVETEKSRLFLNLGNSSAPSPNPSHQGRGKNVFLGLSKKSWMPILIYNM